MFMGDLGYKVVQIFETDSETEAMVSVQEVSEKVYVEFVFDAELLVRSSSRMAPASNAPCLHIEEVE